MFPPGLSDSRVPFSWSLCFAAEGETPDLLSHPCDIRKQIHILLPGRIPQQGDRGWFRLLLKGQVCFESGFGGREEKEGLSDCIEHILNYFLNVCGRLPAWMSVCQMHVVPMETRGGLGSPGTGIIQL